MQTAARTRVNRVIVERRAQHLRLPGASRVGPHEYGSDWMPAGVEPEETMPECRNADRAGVLGRPVRMDGVQTRGDGLQEPVRVVLDSAIPSQPGRVLDLVGAPGDRPTMAVIERR